MGPVQLGWSWMQEETVEKELIHRSVAAYGANYYVTACGLYDGTTFVHRSKSEITCPRCRTFTLKENQ